MASDSGCYCGELASVDRPCTPGEFPATAWLPSGHEDEQGTRVLCAIFAEIDRAHAKHGRSFEEAPDHLKLVIMAEEDGEVARALLNILACSGSTERMTTAEVLEQRDKRALHRENLVHELVQSASLRFRWLMLLLADQQKEADRG